MKSVKKQLILFCQAIILISISLAYGQQKQSIIIGDGDDAEKSTKEAAAEYGTINEKVSFGLSLGYNFGLKDLTEVQISPINNQLLVSDIQNTSFVLSTIISVPISFKDKGYRLLDKTGEPTGQVYRVSNWGIIAAVNLATLQGAQTGTVFNQKISGGLGISYSITEYFSLGLTFEMIAYRKPKDFLLEFSGSEVIIDEKPLTSLDISNNQYFEDRYAETISFKAIYKFTK